MENTGLYLQVLFEAMWLASIIPMGNDTAFHAMQSFGGYNMEVAVILSIIGGTLGQLFNYALGRGLQRLKYTKNMTMSEDFYVRFEYYFNRYGIYALVLSWITLGKLLPLAAGVANAPARKVIPLIVAGYIYHYGSALFI